MSNNERHFGLDLSMEKKQISNERSIYNTSYWNSNMTKNKICLANQIINCLA